MGLRPEDDRRREEVLSLAPADGPGVRAEALLGHLGSREGNSVRPGREQYKVSRTVTHLS